MWQREQAQQHLEARGQQHVLRFFDRLDPQQQRTLLSELEQIDFDWLDLVIAELIRGDDATLRQPEAILPYRDVIRLGDASENQAQAVGEEALRQGRVAVLLVAGGQGTRLGFDGPKGAVPLGPISGRTLFRMHAERVLALGRRYKVVPPLYVMTSPANHHQTCQLFSQDQHYGLPPDRVVIFPQGTAPALDEQGKLLLAQPDRLVLAPNGNGGLFAAMDKAGVFEQMRELGADTISYIQVDNALALSADPRFVGHHLRHGSQFSCKAVPKLHPRERVGNFARVGGRLGIVEYTEIPSELAEQRDDSGELVFGYGNPGLFIWSRAFAEVQAQRRDLPVHRAHKKIPHLDARGLPVQPEHPNGYKLETFALDTLPTAERAIVVACERDAEFAPVKNATGDDSPASARRLLSQLHRGWIERAGGRVDEGIAVEISPLYALDEAELADRIETGMHLSADLFVGPPS